MTPRERWQTLQAHLTVARSALDAGDRASALAAIDAALAIDPNFLAAHSLRERATRVTASPAVPLVSAEGYAQFEQRARRRRVDRRVDAARTALASGKVKDAAAALEEIVELDPNLPELPQLITELRALRMRTSTPHAGRWLAAAAAFVIIVLGASWLQESGGVAPRFAAVVAPSTDQPRDTQTAAVADVPVTDAASQVEVATTGVDPGLAIEPARSTVEPERLPAPPPPVVMAGFVPSAAPADSGPSPRTPALEPDVVPAAAPSVQAASSLGPSVVLAAATPPPAPILPAAMPASSSAVAPISTPSAVSAPPVAAPPPPAAASTPAVVTASLPLKPDEDALVRQTLQRYRIAYEGLDARSAHAVWPAVNEGALARAFDGLESQTLTFNACDIRLRGEAAEATCNGTARYVPKIGSREPRVEPRTWNFTLRKSGTLWQIESARAGR